MDFLPETHQTWSATMRARVRHRNASLPHRWRDDVSQVICASYHDFLDGAQLPCLILRHLLEGFFFFLAISPFRGFHFSSESVFVFFPLSTFQRKNSNASSLCEYNQYHCSTSLASSTPWLAIPAVTGPVFLLAFLFQLPLETFLLLIFLGNNIPTSLVRIVRFQYAPFSPQTHVTATLSMVRHLFCHQ